MACCELFGVEPPHRGTDVSNSSPAGDPFLSIYPLGFFVKNVALNIYLVRTMTFQFLVN